MIYRSLFFLLCSFGSLSLPAQNTVDIMIHRPAEYGLLAYSKITLAGVTASTTVPAKHITDIGDELTAQLFATHRYEVVDREHLAAIMEEQKLSFDGLIDESTAYEVGKIIGPSVMIFVRIQEDRYTESTWQEEASGAFTQQKMGRKYRRGSHLITLHIKAVDVETAKVVLAKSVSGQAERTQVTSGPISQITAADIDQYPLYQEARHRAVEQLVRLIAPHQERVKLTLETSPHLPEVAAAVSYFRINEWQTGMQILTKQLTNTSLKSDIKAKALYNVALVKTYSGAHDAAITYLKQALKLDPQNKTYLDGIALVKREQELAMKLDKQLKVSVLPKR